MKPESGRKPARPHQNPRRRRNLMSAFAITRKAIAALTAVLTIVATGDIPAFAAAPPAGNTTTPIQHIVIIFNENISFDHYFGTYPNATNPAGEPPFNARPN